MAKISLRMYNREIEGLIEQGQRLDEAIAHCRHILKTYPKHLETYRLLGKAYLEAKRYDAAVDIFQRVLVVAPDDFVSHVGMSIIADDKGKLDDAIWHMERAFEVQPSNAAIQGELQRLFGRRDGVEPPKIRLTRGALAHMYVQGELFTQAISEIRTVLANDARRTDMQTLLARAYYRNGQKAEATEICTELLSKYQYCLVANQLMAEIVPGTQRADTAPQYRQRVIELDPYTAYVHDSIFRADSVADNLVTIERLEYTGETAEMPGPLGIGLEPEPATAPRAAVPGAGAASAPGTNLPTWLQGTADESAQAAPATPTAEADIPDFLKKAGWGAVSAEAAAEAVSPFGEKPEIPPGPGGAVEGDLPEWVKALAPKEESRAEEAAPATPESELLESKSPASQVFPTDTPDWLRELGEQEPAQQAPAAPSAPPASEAAVPSEAPDWLRDIGEQEPTQPPPAAPEPQPASAEAPTLPPDVPDWLRDLGPVSSVAESSAAQAPEETPDWLKDLAGRELDEPAAPAEKESETDWLGDLRAQQPSPAQAEPAPDESPEWLKEFDNDLETPIAKATPPVTPAPPELPTPAPPAPVAPETPTIGLGSLGTTAQEQDDAMAWLESLAAKHGAKPEELVTNPEARTDVAPEWVDKAKEIGEQPLEAAPTEDETGIWLRSLAEAEKNESAEPEPEQPAQEEPFDFRRAFQDQTSFAGAEPEPAREEPPSAELPETPAWLSDFSSKQVERSGMEDAPDWLRGISREAAEEPESAPRAEANVPTAPLRPRPESEPAAPAAQPPSEEGGTELPAWLLGLESEESAVTHPLSSEPPSDELPAWLQAEAEPEPEAKQPANPADWHPVEQKPVEPQQPVSAMEPEPVQPQEPVIPPPQPLEVHRPVVEARPQPEEVQPPVVEMPAQPVRVEHPVSEAEQQPVEQPSAPEPARVEKPTAPAPARPKPAVPAAKAPMPSLGDAQFQLGRGNIAAALDMYGKLIRKGKSLEDVIRDLRDALYRYPVEVPLWQSLGDAYMRANRLQEALDAYTKAEELLR